MLLGSLVYWTTFACFLLCIKKLDWKYSSFIYLTCVFMQLVTFWNGSRALAVLFPSLLLVKALKAQTWKSRIIWSSLTGLVSFACFLYTFEIGIYSLIACGIVCAGLGVLGIANRYLKIPDLVLPLYCAAIFAIIVTVFVIGNLALSLTFKLTSPNYENFFDFQYYALELVRGHANVMGWVIGLKVLHLVIIGLLAVYCIGFIVANIKVSPIGEIYLFIALLVPALIQLKSLFLRAVNPFTIVVRLPVVFLIIGYPGWQARQLRWVWGIILALFIACWGNFTVSPFNTLTATLEGRNDVPGKFFEFFTARPVSPRVLPPALKEAVASDPKVKLFTFPYQHGYALTYGKENPHALIQSYVAVTLPLQDKVVRELSQSLSQVEVLFSAEAPGKGSEIVDNVSDPTRSPRIFEYLYSHFEIKKDAVLADRFLVLKPRETPRGFEGVPLNFRQEGPSVSLYEPTKCTLVRLTTTINYPPTRLLTRPGGIQALFYLTGDVVRRVNLTPLEIGQSFTTYLPLYTPNGATYREMFANRPVGTQSWDSLRFEPRDSGLLGVSANEVRVEKLECIGL
jgi:hypothetical protein